jgi:hypothetical protein
MIVFVGCFSVLRVLCRPTVRTVLYSTTPIFYYFGKDKEQGQRDKLKEGATLSGIAFKVLNNNIKDVSQKSIQYRYISTDSVPM